MANRFKQLFTLVDIDMKLARALFGLGLVVLLLAVITVFGSIFVILVSLTLILASGVYILLNRRRQLTTAKEDGPKPQNISLIPPRLNQLLDIAFWGMLIVCLLLISQQVYVRPLSFLILISVMSAILGVQIFAGRNTSYCLIKILVIAILLRASVWFQFPGPVGRDPIKELDYMRQLVAVGHLNEYMESYMFYPVAHILGAATHFITGMGLKTSFFIISIAEVMSLAFLFLIGKELFNKKIGLLAALIIAVSASHILYGSWMKGMSLGIAFLPILLFFLIASRRNGVTRPFLILSITIMFLLILTHTIAPFVTLVILVIAWIASQICRVFPSKAKFESPVLLATVLIFLVGLLSYWVYYAGMINYLGVMIEQVLATGVVIQQPVASDRSVLDITFQHLPKLVFVFFTILGGLSVLNIQNLDRKTLLQVWLLITAVLMMMVTFLINYMGTFGALIPARWFVFMNLLIALPSAIGILRMVGRKRWSNVVVPFVVLLLITGIMTTAYQANITQVVPWVTQSRDAFTTSEMMAAGTVSQKTDFKSDQYVHGEAGIHADFLYRVLLIFEFNVPRAEAVDASPLFTEEETEYHGILLLRSVITDIALITYDEEHRYSAVDQSLYQYFFDDTQASMIYNNGQVKALKRP